MEMLDRFTTLLATRVAMNHVRSPSAHFAAFFGFLAYLSYGSARDGWTNPALIGTAIIFAVALPYYAFISNVLERRVMEVSALVTPGRLARFGAQFAFNFAVMFALDHSGLFGADKAWTLRSMGGAVGVAVLITAASQGAQFFGLYLARRGIGDPMRNVQFGLSANIAASAVATVGLPQIADAYMVISLFIGGIAVLNGILSDVRSLVPRKGGIAVYFGTFNPVHKGHMECVRAALESRGVERVIIHPTVVPKGHVDALACGHIEAVDDERGYTIYQKTNKADPLLDYFPTGDRFLSPETRRDLIQAAIDDVVAENPDLVGRIEVAWLPNAYAASGFRAVLRELRRRHPGCRVHGIHGNDTGGMMVRAILDDCGWVYPFVVRRLPGFSGTAVRNGDMTMTTRTVAQRLEEIAHTSGKEAEDERLVA